MNLEVSGTTKLNQLSKVIISEMESAQASFMKIGECLCHAKDRLMEEGLKQADVVKWSDDNCGIKKAQMYKLISVFENFGGNTDFQGVSMRVLSRLTQKEIPKEVIEDARAAAIKGALDTPMLEKILRDNEPEPKEPKEPKSSGTVITCGGSKQVAKVIPKKEPETDETLSDSKVQELEEVIKTLNNTIALLNKELSEKDKPKSVAKMPTLPQFKSKAMHVRLGLTIEESTVKKEINKAYRALAKIWTETANKGAAKSILVARDSLIKGL